MKIFVNDKVYVQKNDLAHLMHYADGTCIPASIFNSVFNEIFLVTDNNRYEFIEFTDPDDIEFFKSCDWIFDYNLIDGMNEKEIIEYAKTVEKERTKLADDFNKLPIEEREKNYSKIMNEVELLDFKILSIRDAFWHKKGHLKFKFPEGANVSYLDSNGEVTIKEDKNLLKKVLRLVIK